MALILPASKLEPGMRIQAASGVYTVCLVEVEGESVTLTWFRGDHLRISVSKYPACMTFEVIE